MKFELIHPAWLGFGLLTILASILLPRWGQGPGADLRPLRRRLVIAVRAVILLLLWLAVAGLRVLLPGDRQTVFFLVDRSLSARAHEAFARDYLTRCLPLLKERQEVSVITFGGDAVMEVPPSRLDKLPPFTGIISRNQTDIASAVRLACAGLPANSSGRLVLLSDGQETRGDAAAEMEVARRMGLDVAVIPYPEGTRPEVLVESLKTPDKVRPEAPFEVGVTLQSSREGSDCELILTRDSRPVASQRVQLHKGKNFYLLPQKVDKAGVVHYSVSIQSLQDTEPANNQADSTVVVEGPAKLLYVVAPGAHPPLLVETLRSSGLLVDVCAPSQLPADLGSWQAYQAVILDDVSALDMSALQLDWLTALVREAGIGLTMLGGTNSFGAGGYHSTSLAQILPVSLEIRRRKNTPASAMIFIIDKSGSMGEKEGDFEKMQMAREAANGAVEMMSPEDEVGVIAFDDAYKWLVHLQKVTDPQSIINTISTLRAGGGTSLYGGLEAALNTLQGDAAPVRHALVLTDGMVEPANFKFLATMAAHNRITISTVAVGQDADLKFLAKLAEDGKGRAFVANSAGMLPRVFARDTVLASRQAFVEKPSRALEGEGHAILRGVDVKSAPDILGYNLVSPKGAPAQTLLAGGDPEQPDPLLAAGRAGLGKVVAFTGDSGERWSKTWTAWPGFAQLMVQAVRWTLPEIESNRVQFRLQPGPDDRTLLTATILSKSSAPDLQVGLISPTGQGSKVDLKQVGPGRYQALLEADQPGSWLLHAEGAGVGWTRSLNVPYSRELASLGSDKLRLQAIAAAGQGAYNASPDSVMALPTQPRKFPQEIWPQLVLLALLLMPLEVALRRVFWVWKPRRRPVGPTPPETPVTSQRLLATKQRTAPTRRRLTPHDITPVVPPALPETPPPAPKPAASPSPDNPLDRLKQAKNRRKP